MTTDLVSLLRQAARRWPERDALVFDASGTRLTFADVDRRSGELAILLADAGVRRGDRVALMLRNQPEFPLLWLAIGKLGAITVPLNTSYRELDGAHVLAHSGARFAVAGSEFVELLHTITPRTSLERLLDVAELDATPDISGREFRAASEQIANIQYTSGTTGTPKGCLLPHRYWTRLAHTIAGGHPAIGDSDVLLTAQPFHYVDPQWNVAVGLTSGATLVVLDRFHPATFWSKVREYGVTWFYCLGMMPTLLLRTPESADDRTHRVRAISASAIPKDSHAALQRRWGVPWYEAFGMTETGSDLRVLPQDQDDVVGTGCIGTPAADREVLIADASGCACPRGETGELLIRGVGLMHGYHEDPRATAHAFRNGWFHTGDLATMDDAGRVYYVGRTKDMIRRSGENVAADEVERALLLHPDVRLAAVIAVPDEVRGEEIKACVVLSEDAADGRKPQRLAEFCAARLAYFKVPRYWAFVDTLPMTASERVAKGELRAQADLTAGSYDRVAGAWL